MPEWDFFTARMPLLRLLHGHGVYACVCCKRRQAGQWSLVGADVFLMDRVSEALQRRWLTTSAALTAS